MGNGGKFVSKKAGTFLLMKDCREYVPNQTANNNLVSIICLFFQSSGVMCDRDLGTLEGN